MSEKEQNFMDLAEKMANNISKEKNIKNENKYEALNVGKTALSMIPRKVKTVLFIVIVFSIYGIVEFSIHLYNLIIYYI